MSLGLSQECQGAASLWACLRDPRTTGMFRLQHPEPERAEKHLLMMGPPPSSQTCAFSPNTEHRAYTCQTICELLAVDYEG